jgi:hypothetical protein
VDTQDSDQVANILSLYEQTAKNEGYEQGHLHGFLTGVLVGAVLGVLAAFLCGAWYFSTRNDSIDQEEWPFATSDQ